MRQVRDEQRVHNLSCDLVHLLSHMRLQDRQEKESAQRRKSTCLYVK